MKPLAELSPSPLTVLDTKGMARWLRCSERTIQRRNYPHIPDEPGKYLVQDILDYWAKKKAAA